MRVSRPLTATTLVLAAFTSGCGEGRVAPQGVTLSSKRIASAAVLHRPRELRTMVDDSTVGTGPDEFHYTGRWQHVLAHRDGRALGTSSRSFHDGDSVEIAFTGTRIRVYGIVGKRGGYGSIAIDGVAQTREADFYAPDVSSALVYESPPLAAGSHTLTLSVKGSHPAASDGDYVNLDFAVITTKG